MNFLLCKVLKIFWSAIKEVFSGDGIYGGRVLEISCSKLMLNPKNMKFYEKSEFSHKNYDNLLFVKTYNKCFEKSLDSCENKHKFSNFFGFSGSFEVSVTNVCCLISFPCEIDSILLFP